MGSGITADFDGEGRVRLAKRASKDDDWTTVIDEEGEDLDISAVIYSPSDTGRDKYSLNLSVHNIESDDGADFYRLGLLLDLDRQQLTTLFYALDAIIKIERDNAADEEN